MIGVLAVAVIPAISSMDEAKKSAAAEEVERRLVLARGEAIAQGRPIGLYVNPTADTVQMFTIRNPGDAPTPTIMGDGTADSLLSIPAQYPGAQVTSLSAGDGSTTAQVLWFGYDGTPQIRSAGGTLAGSATADAVINFQGGASITIRRHSGAVQR